MWLKKVLLGTSILTLLILQLVLIYKDVIEEEELSKTPPLQKIQGLYVIGSNNRQRTWKLYSKTAFYKIKKEFLLETVSAEFFFNNSISFKIVSDRGNLHLLEKDFDLKGNVQIESRNNLRFFTDLARYISSERTLRADKVFIKSLSKDGLSLKGEELFIAINKKYLEIEKPLVSSKNIKIKANKAFLKDGKKNIHFSDDIEVELQSYKVTSKKAFLSYKDASFTPHFLQMSNQVRLTGRNVWAVSSKMKVDLPKQKYIFEGNSRLLYNYSELKGEKIIFYGKTKKLDIIKGQLEFQRGIKGE